MTHFLVADERVGCAGKTVRSLENVPYLSASEVMIHEDALAYIKRYIKTIVYVPFPLPFIMTIGAMKTTTALVRVQILTTAAQPRIIKISCEHII